LSLGQRRFLDSKISELQTRGKALSSDLRHLAVLLENADSNPDEIRNVLDIVSNDLRDTVQQDPKMSQLAFMTGDYFRAVVAKRETEGVVAIGDLETREPGLRYQIGFYSEGPSTAIEDLSGFEAKQFSVATADGHRMRIRVPVVSDGFYLGDLVAEYESKR
jgi:hypothetical protein